MVPFTEFEGCSMVFGVFMRHPTGSNFEYLNDKEDQRKLTTQYMILVKVPYINVSALYHVNFLTS